MSCIKFPTSKSDLSNKENKEKEYTNDHASINLQLITAAHETFGSGGWSHAITNQTLDFIDYINGRYQAGCASIVKVQLKSGEYHEAVGYYATDGSSKASAIQKVRLASLNDALKKALICFNCNVSCKVIKSLSQSVSSPSVESSSAKVKQIPPKLPAATHINNDEAFAEAIPMSQADALMDIAEIDQLFEKDQQLNEVTIPSKKVVNLPVAADKENKGFTQSNVDSSKNTKSSTQNDERRKKTAFTSSNGLRDDKSRKSNLIINIDQNSTSERAKSSIHKVMTEEEMRQERKRKQREMQEEFKRKEKMKCTDNENKESPNPRY